MKVYTNSACLNQLADPSSSRLELYVPNFIAYTSKDIDSFINRSYFHTYTPTEAYLYAFDTIQMPEKTDITCIESIQLLENTPATKKAVVEQRTPVIENQFDGIQFLSLRINRLDNRQKPTDSYLETDIFCALQANRKIAFSGLKHSGLDICTVMYYLNEYVSVPKGILLGPSVVVMSKKKNDTAPGQPFAIIPESYISKFNIPTMSVDYTMPRAIKELQIGYWYSSPAGTAGLYCGVIDGKLQFIEPKDKDSIDESTLIQNLRSRWDAPKLKSIKKHGYVTEHNSVSNDTLIQALEWVEKQHSPPVGVI